MVGFQMFPRSYPSYVFVTKIPWMLILYFAFLKNKDNSPLNDTVVIESALYVFFVLFECFLLFLADSASYLLRTSRWSYLYYSSYLFWYFSIPLRHGSRTSLWGGVSEWAQWSTISSPQEACPHPSKFLLHYINYGYQNTGFLKLSKIVAWCHTLFFLNLKFFLKNLGFGRGNLPHFPCPASAPANHQFNFEFAVHYIGTKKWKIENHVLICWRQRN